ncbi:HD domain-containing protein [Candidatus Fermentibacteria bacterium]|nr:HD domain-containing protein [Candidatus Fermentibacteria bacterium]
MPASESHPERDYHLSVLMVGFYLAVIIGSPVRYVDLPSHIELTTFLLVWAGVLGSTAFTFAGTTGFRITLLPCIQALLVLTGFTPLIEGGFVLACFLGTLSFHLRIGAPPRDSALRATGGTLAAYTGLRLSRALLTAVLPSPPAGFWESALAAVACLVAVVAANSVLGSLPSTLRGRSLHRLGLRFLHKTGVGLVFLPLLLPTIATGIKRPTGRGTLQSIGLEAGLLALIVSQIAFSTALERSKYTRGSALAVENALARLTGALSRASSPLGALRALAESWLAASRSRRLEVGWENVSYRLPPGRPDREETRPLRRTGSAGLTVKVWPEAGTILDGARLDTFIAQTEAAIQDLHLRRTVNREAWSCMEAMVYSMDRSDKRLAGHSKSVAEVATAIGRGLGLHSLQLENLRMAALLHHLDPKMVLADQTGEEPGAESEGHGGFELPREAVRTILHARENFDGTGKPDGLSGEDIPLLSRILSIADTYVTERERSDPETAYHEVSRRAGSIFDPSVVEILQNVVGNRA